MVIDRCFISFPANVCYRPNAEQTLRCILVGIVRLMVLSSVVCVVLNFNINKFSIWREHFPQW
jgi:hypothetical protein